MSLDASPLPPAYDQPCSICIVASLFNERHTNALVDNCLTELNKFAPQAQVNVIRVPGAYEIPVTAAAIIASPTPPDVMIAFGVIIRGGTEHGDLIANAATASLQNLSVASRIPIINQVLLVNNTDQANERCMGEELNRGREGAYAAVSMLHVRAQIKTHYFTQNV